jgi:hypothetical protein
MFLALKAQQACATNRDTVLKRKAKLQKKLVQIAQLTVSNLEQNKDV